MFAQGSARRENPYRVTTSSSNDPHFGSVSSTSGLEQVLLERGTSSTVVDGQTPLEACDGSGGFVSEKKTNTWQLIAVHKLQDVG